MGIVQPEAIADSPAPRGGPDSRGATFFLARGMPAPFGPAGEESRGDAVESRRSRRLRRPSARSAIAEAAPGCPRQSGHQEMTPAPDIASARAGGDPPMDHPMSQAWHRTVLMPVAPVAMPPPPDVDRSACIVAWTSVKGTAALSGRKPARPAKRRKTAARQEAGQDQGRSHSPRNRLHRLPPPPRRKTGRGEDRKGRTS